MLTINDTRSAYTADLPSVGVYLSDTGVSLSPTHLDRIDQREVFALLELMDDDRLCYCGCGAGATFYSGGVGWATRFCLHNALDQCQAARETAEAA